MNEDFIEVKESLIDMYNFNKHIKVELKPLGAKAILDYIDSKDKEIKRLNNIIEELEVELLTDSALYVNAPEIRQIYIDIYEKLQELKQEN